MIQGVQIHKKGWLSKGGRGSPIHLFGDPTNGEAAGLQVLHFERGGAVDGVFIAQVQAVGAVDVAAVGHGSDQLLGGTRGAGVRQSGDREIGAGFKAVPTLPSDAIVEGPDGLHGLAVSLGWVSEGTEGQAIGAQLLRAVDKTQPKSGAGSRAHAVIGGLEGEDDRRIAGHGHLQIEMWQRCDLGGIQVLGRHFAVVDDAAVGQAWSAGVRGDDALDRQVHGAGGEGGGGASDQQGAGDGDQVLVHGLLSRCWVN